MVLMLALMPQAEALAYVMRQEVLRRALGFRRLKAVLKMLEAKMFEVGGWCWVGGGWGGAGGVTISSGVGLHWI